MSTTFNQSDTFALGDRIVKRLGYGAMQLAGPFEARTTSRQDRIGRPKVRSRPHSPYWLSSSARAWFVILA